MSTKGRYLLATAMAVVMGLHGLDARGQTSPGAQGTSSLDDLAPSGLTPNQRKAGTNAKLDNRLIHLRDAAPSPATARSASGSRSEDTLSIQAPPTVSVDIVVNGDTQAALQKLQAIGFKVDAVFGNHVGGELPVSHIDDAAEIGEVKRISAARMRTKAGALNGQGDYSQLSRRLRESVKGLTGKGITVGVISNSFDCAGYANTVNAGTGVAHFNDQADNVASGDLPAKASIRIVKEGSCGVDADGNPTSDDEGRAMAEIIHDIAPDAAIAFYGPSATLTDFAQGIQTLALPVSKKNAVGTAGGGADIIVDDLGFNEPTFQSGIGGAAIDGVVEAGVPYFTAGGNDSNGVNKINYINNGAVFSTTPVPSVRNKVVLNAGQRLLNFDQSGKTSTYTIPLHGITQNRAGNYLYTVDVNWDQPYDDSASSIEACLGDAKGNPLYVVQGGRRVLVCSGASAIGGQASVSFGVYLPNSDVTLRIGHAGGDTPGRILVRGSAGFDRFGTDLGNLYGHVISPNALTLGAADYLDTPKCDPTLPSAVLEYFSSRGGSLLVLDNQDRRLKTPTLVKKPEIVAPDGASSVFFGGESRRSEGLTVNDAACRYDSTYRHNFYGTSAAAPHAAAVAALLKQAQPKATVSDIYGALTRSAEDMGDAGYDYPTGHGFIQADRAYIEITKPAQ